MLAAHAIVAYIYPDERTSRDATWFRQRVEAGIVRGEYLPRMARAVRMRRRWRYVPSGASESVRMLRSVWGRAQSARAAIMRAIMPWFYLYMSPS